MIKKITLLLFLLLAFFITSSASSFAFENTASSTLVIPVDQLDPAANPLNLTTLDFPEALYYQATPSATPITWLISPRALAEENTLLFFQKIASDPTQEIGLWLTPDDQTLASLDLKNSTPTNLAYLLNSYSPANRLRLLDQLFTDFFTRFNFYPATVGATYIDSFSLSHLADQYLVTGAVFNLPPHGDAPRYLSSPLLGFYLPYRQNSLVPAHSRFQQIPLALTYWNPPDLFGQSPDLSASPFDSQTAYFTLYSDTALSELIHTDLGVANNYSPTAVTTLLANFTSLFPRYHIFSQTRQHFSQMVIRFYPETSPAHTFIEQHNNQTKIRYENPFYALSLSSTPRSQIESLLVFNNLEAEEFFASANTLSPLFLNTHNLLTTPVDFPLDLKAVSFSVSGWRLKLSQGDSALTLAPQQLLLDQLKLNLPSHPALTQRASTVKINSSWAPFHFTPIQLLLHLAKLLLLIGFFLLGLRFLFHFRLRLPRFIFLFPILLGSLTWSLLIVKNNTFTPFGLSYWGASSHDGLFHLSLIESFKRSFFTLQNPNLYHQLLKNYHFFYDYLLALLSFFLRLPPSLLYFQFFPPLMAVTIGLLSLRLLKRWHFSSLSIVISLLLLYFSGSLGFIPGLFHSPPWSGESAFWMQQAVSTLINPPFALSLIFLLVFLNLLESWLASLTLPRIITLSLIAALLIQTKAYALILLLGALGLTFLTQIILHRQKSPSFPPLLLLIIFTAIFSFIFFIPTYDHSNTLFQFRPLWFIDSMFASPDRLNLPRFALIRDSAITQGNFLKLFLLQALGLCLFLIGNLGTRLLAFPSWISGFSHRQLTRQLVSWLIPLGLVLPLLFIQSGNSWNSIQFSYYSLFFLSLFSGPVIKTLLYRLHILPHFILLVFFISGLTLPTTIGAVRQVLSSTPSTYISYPELRLLAKLASLPPVIVLAPPYNLQTARNFPTPKPLFAYTSTAYIPALTGQSAYLADEINLIISNYHFQTHKKNLRQLFNTPTSVFTSQLLSSLSPLYLYQTPDHPQAFSSLTPLYTTGNYTLYNSP